jgi:hypothetical protein
MTDHVWDVRTGAHLLSIRDGRAYRARDGQEIGRVVDGNVYEFDGRFICCLERLEAAELPEPLKLLLE